MLSRLPICTPTGLLRGEAAGKFSNGIPANAFSPADALVAFEGLLQNPATRETVRGAARCRRRPGGMERVCVAGGGDCADLRH